MARQELTSNRETGWLGKPRPEQDRIRGRNCPEVCGLRDKFKVLGRDPRVGRLTLVVTSELDGWSPLRPCRGTELGLQACLPRNFFSETNVANDRDEPQALTKGLSEERTRARTTSQRPQASLLNHSPPNRIPVHGQHIPPAPGFYSFLCPETNPRVAGYLR
jgi:hypothetical protein